MSVWKVLLLNPTFLTRIETRTLFSCPFFLELFESYVWKLGMAVVSGLCFAVPLSPFAATGTRIFHQPAAQRRVENVSKTNGMNMDIGKWDEHTWMNMDVWST